MFDTYAARRRDAGGASILARPPLSFFDAERALAADLRLRIEARSILRASRWPLEAERWRPGTPFRLLLVGYNGARNTGADIRTGEIVRQLTTIFEPGSLHATVTVLDHGAAHALFHGARQKQIPTYFPGWLSRQISEHHGVVVCEGSMFKSKFGNALALLFASAIGMARAEQKPALAYGGEAGAMDAIVGDMVRDTVPGAFVALRNAGSIDALRAVGISGQRGADTAWTFRPAPRDEAEAMLRAAGWDGKARVVLVAPVNPHCWPVRPHFARAALQAISGRHDAARYKSFYYHRDDASSHRALHAHIEDLVTGLTSAFPNEKVFFGVIGMEAVDILVVTLLAARLKDRLGVAPAVLTSDTVSPRHLVAVLRVASLLVASRFHALLTSMPAQVPAVGIAIDERARNLMNDLGHPELALDAYQPDLAPRLAQAIARVLENRRAYAHDAGRMVARELVQQGLMGMKAAAYLRGLEPALPLRLLGESPLHYLPALDDDLTTLLAQFGSARDEV